MKKYVIGFILGTMVAGTSAVYASSSNIIQAVLFPAKYQINGTTQELPSGYSSLSVDGHTYVPIRYVAESLGAVVAYDEATMTIQVDNTFDVMNMNSGIRAGHLQVTKADNQTIVEGKLFVGQQHWDAMADSRKSSVQPGAEVEVRGDLMFFNDTGRFMGKAPVRSTFIAKGDQIRNFKAIADHDVSGYAFAMLAYVGPVPSGLPLPPNVTDQDPTKSLSVGDYRLIKQDGFTQVHGWVSLNKSGNFRYDATLTFYDAEGKSMGTADLKGTGSGSNEYFSATTFETAGKGDFTGYKSVKVTVNAFDPITEVSEK